MSRLVLTALLVTLATAPAIGVRQGPPGDGDVRTTRETGTDDTLTTLTLMLKGPKGPLPINLSITTRRKVRASPGEPLGVKLDFDMPLFTGVLDRKTPHLVAVIDKDLKTEWTYKDSIESAALMLDEATHYTLPFDMVNLAKFADATTIEGRVFGVDFVLTPSQLQAIKDFKSR